jgi:hypothetical protein
VTIVALGVTLGISTSTSAWAEVKTKADPCDQRLPKSLKEVLHKAYPDHRVVSFSMLTDVGQKFYSRASKSRCPGVAKVRFFDKNKMDYAVVLVNGMDQPYLYNRFFTFIVAKKGDNASWQLVELEKDQQDASPAVLTLPPNKYTGDGIDEQPHTLESKNEALILIGYESWSIVYVATEKGIEKVWLSD